MDRTAFYAALRSRASTLFGTSLSQGQVNTLTAILDEAERRGLILTHLAYVLATPYHEVGSSLQPIRENMTYTSAARIHAVWPSRFKTSAAAAPYVRQPQKLANFVYGGRMGNVGPNDGWLYRGGGLPQVTGRAMYAKIGKLIGADLVGHPDYILEIDVAVAAMFEGMIDGLFTGKKLSDFLNATATDYRGARAIINGDVKANGDKIAGYAREFEAALKTAGYTGQKPKELPPPPVPDAPKPAPIPQSSPPEPAPQASPARAPEPSKSKPAAAAGGLILALAAAAAWWHDITSWIGSFFQ